MDVLAFLEAQLLTCLCEMLATEGRPVCACHKFGGASLPVADRCKRNDAGENGQAWVRRAQQSLQQSEDGTFTGQPCSGAWSDTIELGIYRCLKAVPNEKGQAPPVEYYDEDYDLLTADRLTLSRVLCCDVLRADATLPVNAVFTVEEAEISPHGPSGACGGSILTLRISTVLESTERDPEQLFVSQAAGGG